MHLDMIDAKLQGHTVSTHLGKLLCGGYVVCCSVSRIADDYFCWVMRHFYWSPAIYYGGHKSCPPVVLGELLPDPKYARERSRELSISSFKGGILLHGGILHLGSLHGLVYCLRLTTFALIGPLVVRLIASI
jgi:hypothetical protein